MRLILYYMAHSFWNQLRKLFRTWVIVFILVCFVLGGLIGGVVGLIASTFEDKEAEMTETAEVEPAPDAKEGETEEIENLFSVSEEDKAALVELAAGAVVLVALVLAVLTADKSGSSIFLPADVNLLFPAPMKPQSVLLFRIIMQAASSIFITFIMLFQLPNLILNAGLSPAVAFTLLGVWFLMLVYTRLISVLLFTLASTHPGLKKRMRTGLFAVLLLVVAGFWVYRQTAAPEATLLQSFDGFFNAPASRYIPVWGWLKGIAGFAAEGNARGALILVGTLIVSAVALVYIIWHIKADFYEEALQRSSETAALQAAQQSGRALTAAVPRRKKDRSEKLIRDAFTRGAGATVYFHKAMYNRYRFAHLHFFTKTSETYLLTALALSVLFRFVLTEATGYGFIITALVLAAITFFRALGNPIATDIAQESFFLIPDTAHRKVFFSFMAGVVNTLLDLLPAFALATVLLWNGSALEMLGGAVIWFLLIVALGAYCSGVGMFIDLSVSTGLSQTLRSFIQIMFIYFGLAPVGLLLGIGLMVGHLLAFAAVAVVFCVGLAALSLAVSPLFVEHGRR